MASLLAQIPCNLYPVMLHRVGHGLAITPAVVGRRPLQPLPGYVASVGLALLSARPLQPLPGYVASAGLKLRPFESLDGSWRYPALHALALHMLHWIIFVQWQYNLLCRLLARPCCGLRHAGQRTVQVICISIL